MKPTHTRCPQRACITFSVLFVCLVIVAGFSEAHAQGEAGSAYAQSQEVYNDAFATVLGPQLSVNGPPTALQVQAQYWHRLRGAWSFHSVLGMTFTGETSIEGETRSEHYDSTLGATFGAGVRLDLDLGAWPLETFTRADLAFEFTAATGLIGYVWGPAVAFGINYPLTENLGLMAEVETTFGYGLFQASGSVFAWTVDALVGAQVRF